MGFLPPLQKGAKGEALSGRPGKTSLDFRTQQGERRCRERPCRMYGLDFWRSRTAQPKGEVRKRGIF